MSSDPADLKRQAAERALDYVRPGMKLGLGTGSTAALFVEALGARGAGDEIGELAFDALDVSDVIVGRSSSYE